MEQQNIPMHNQVPFGNCADVKATIDHLFNDVVIDSDTDYRALTQTPVPVNSQQQVLTQTRVLVINQQHILAGQRFASGNQNTGMLQPHDRLTRLESVFGKLQQDIQEVRSQQNTLHKKMNEIEKLVKSKQPSRAQVLAHKKLFNAVKSNQKAVEKTMKSNQKSVEKIMKLFEPESETIELGGEEVK